MIKRRPCLSVAAGGSVATIEVEGKPKKLTTYCRLYNTAPHKRGILCLGFMDYPPCPDLGICRVRLPVPEKPLEEELEDGADES
jgi:hypothetical protein